ncbi:HTH-type transcriptional repressor PurR [Streptomyces violaceorubidus]
MPNARRADGYRQAMRAHGLERWTDVVSTSYTEGGYQGAKQLLTRPHRPTAVFAGADIAAMGVLEAVTEAGLSVPDDISVAGYDNTAFAALGQLHSPASTRQATRWARRRPPPPRPHHRPPATHDPVIHSPHTRATPDHGPTGGARFSPLSLSLPVAESQCSARPRVRILP